MKLPQKFGSTGYFAIAITCLIYGGIALIIFFNLAYFAFLRSQFISSNASNNISNAFNISRPFNHEAQERFRLENSLTPLILTFTGAVVSILAGVSLINLLRKKERNELKREIVGSMITPEEKSVILELEKENGELTQSELVSKTGLGKVKIHRILKRLEALGIVRKIPYGMTNKIRLEKKLSEEE